MQYGLPGAFPQMGLSRDFWIRRTMTAMSCDVTQRYVISDLRFVHEVSQLRMHDPDTFIIKIHRGNGCASVGSGSGDDHCSEQEFKDIQEDILIHNNFATLEELAVFIRSVLGSLGRKGE